MVFSVKKAVFIASVFLLFSCSQNKSSYFSEISKLDDGRIRNIKIGASIEFIKNNENDTFLLDNTVDYLHYDYDLNMGDSYTVTYDFSDNKLYEVEIASYFDSIEEAAKLFKDFTSHFNGKYGSGKIEEDGYTSWKTKSEQTNDPIEIVMIDDSESYGYTFIRIRTLNY